MSILDTTIVNVALPTLSHELHSTIAQIQWVVTGYILALAAVIPVTGWAARRFGAKRVYLVSLVLFTAGSALCAVAVSTTSLVLFRVLQGMGGGMIMPVGQLIMAQVSGPKRMGRVMGIVAMPAMLAPILGPVLGGVILQNFHWSWIFLVNVPIGVVAFLMGWRMLPHTDSGNAGRLDVLGLVLVSSGAATIVYGLVEARHSRHQPHRPGRDRADPGRVRAGGRLLLARAAHRAPAARHPAVRQPRLRGRLADHVRPRRGAVRRDDPGAPLLPGGPPREPHRDGPAHRPAGRRDAARDAALRTPRRPLRRRARGDLRRLDPVSGHAPAGVHRNEHLGARDLARARPARRRHRLLVHAGDDRRVRLAAPRAALRRDPPAERRPARGRRDRGGGACRRAPACRRPRALARPPRAGLRHRLLVVAGDLRALADPLRGAAASREPARASSAARRRTPRRPSSRSAPRTR